MKDALRLLAYVRPYWHFQFFSILASLGYFGGNLAIPWIEKLLIDDVLGAGNFDRLLPTCGLYLATSLGMFVFTFGVVYFSTKVSESVSKDIQQDAYHHLRTLGFQFYDTQQTGRTMSLLSSDVPTAVGLRALIGDYVIDAVKLVVSVMIVGSISWQLCLFSLLLVVLNVLIPIFLNRPLRKIGEAIQEHKAGLSSVLQESIAGSRELKGLGKEFFDLTKIRYSLSRMLSLNLKQVLVQRIGSINVVLFWMANALIFLVGGRYVFRDAITIGELFAITRYFNQIYAPLNGLVSIHLSIPLQLVAARRVFEFFDRHEAEPQGGSPIEQIKGRVEFSNVSFEYRQGHPSLRDVSFNVEVGSTVAVVGQSGSGKSTLISLIPRFYDPKQGEILIDSMPIREIQIHSLRRHIGIVFQDPFLFSESVAYNIRMGAEAPESVSYEQIVNAAKLANAHDFILKFPEQYESNVGERGIQLSGGEKQRIAIARVLIRNPRILILDEATSSLDAESEALVQDALTHLMIGRTSFVIAHRLSTVLNADKILVLNAGRLVEAGTHWELIQHDGIYNDLFDKQFAAMKEVN
ncbi:MAG: ABC transporter ATP-binding protein [Gammaproteobacteria bacterium]|nr:ABC transporter ATP-binding protein [Gammaproteobacteria bacterium]